MRSVYCTERSSVKWVAEIFQKIRMFELEVSVEIENSKWKGVVVLWEGEMSRCDFWRGSWSDGGVVVFQEEKMSRCDFWRYVVVEKQGGTYVPLVFQCHVADGLHNT